MDPNNPMSMPFSQRREILHKQIGDLRLSLRSSEAQAISSETISDEKLGQLIDQTVVGIYHSTVDGKLVMANAALARIFGFDSPEEMMESVTDIGKQLYVDPEQRDAWCKLFQNQETVGPVLWRGNRINHELLCLEEYARVLRDREGRILGYEGVVLDVTARYTQARLPQSVANNVEIIGEAEATNGVQTNEQLYDELADAQQMIAILREQLDQFEIATMGSQEGLWVGRPLPGQPWDSPETPAWYSSQFKVLLGFEDHEFPPVLESWRSRIHPEDRDRVFQALRDHIEHHVPYDVESRLRTKQGEYRWFRGKGQALYDKQGNFVRGGGTIRDITPQKEAEDALKREHALLTTVVEGTSDIIFVKDHEGRYLLVNSTGAALLGRQIEEVIGRTDLELFPKGTHPLFTKFDNEVIREKTPQSFEIDVEDAGVVSRTFLVSKEIFGQTEEGLEGLFCIARDITYRKAAELTIQEREKRYRAIMENAYDLIAEVDGSATFLYVSPNFEEVLGYAPQTLLRSNIFSLVHPDDQPMVAKEFTAGMQALGAGRSIYRYRHQNGGYRWFESTGRVFQTALGDVRGVIVSRDITEQKKSEEALEAIIKGTVAPGSQDFFQNLVCQLAHEIQVPMVFLAERIEETFPIVHGLAFWHGDRFESRFEYNCLEGPCEKVFEGQPVYFSQGVKELFPDNPTVKALDLEGYRGLPLFNSEGGVVGNLAIMDQKPLNLNAQDRSLLQIFAARAGAELERKRALEALQESQERYRALYDQSPLTYFTVDSHLTILSVNQFGADLLGYTVQELVGQSIFLVLDPEDHGVFLGEIKKSLAAVNQVSKKELRKVKKDGTRFWVKETCRTIVGPNQQKMLLLSCEDITSRKRVEEALEHSERQLRHTQKMEAIGTLAGGIAHDFNNILGAILGFSELALAQAQKEPKLISYLGEVLTAGHRAKELVKQILAFSRRSDHEWEAVDLNVMVQEALRMVRATLPTTIEIRSTVDVESAVVFADSTQMHQVITNLCANAEQAMREQGGVLSLTVTSVEETENSIQEFPELKPGTYVQLTIQDTGQGMSSEVLERIFEPFFTTKSLGEGTGLGLAVVHGIIVGHDGHIAVSSVVGQGTTFKILLPRLDVVLPVQTARATDWPHGAGRVLFVDDEEVLARWGEQVLTHLGYTVVTKTNPHEAVELIRSQPHQFDVVVTDQTMPTMSGEALAKALLEIRRDIPIVLCTGFSHTMSEEKAKQLGFKGFLMKPVNGAMLAKTLQEVFEDLARLSNKSI
jgi:PAS domain S-box-containing protein